MLPAAAWQGPLKGEVEAAAGGKAAPSLKRASSYDRLWSDSVFPECDVPASVRECCVFTGAPAARVGHKPFLLATVRGQDELGRPFEWIARRSRKRVLQPFQCPDPQPPLTWLGSLRWSHAGKPGWWVAITFALGSIIFLATGIARLTRAVSDPATWPPGVGSLAAGLSAWPEMLACYLLFFPATVLQVLEASNMDWDSRLRAWQKGGGEGQKPSPRIIPRSADLHTVSWWAASLQVFGMTGFLMATTAELVGLSVGMSSDAFKWLVFWGFTYGGGAFTVASLLACLEETGSWWRGLVPTRGSDIHSISWAAVFFGFHGSLGFFIFGTAFFFFYDDLSWTQFQWLVGYGQVAASTFFLLSAAAGVLEQGNPSHL